MTAGHTGPNQSPPKGDAPEVTTTSEASRITRKIRFPMNLSIYTDYKTPTESASSPKVTDTQVGVIEGLLTPALNHGSVPHQDHWARLPSLGDALAKAWTEDAMILGYRVTDGNGVLADKFPRLSKGAWCRDRIAKQGLTVETTMILVDVDLVPTDPTRRKQPWTPESTAEFNGWWAAGHSILSQAGVYMTKHGFRLVYVMDAPVDTYTLAEAIGAQVWLDLKASGLETSGRFLVDPSCKDWTRLMRAPRARKDGVNLTPAYEDYSRLTPWTPPVVSPEAMDSISVSGTQVRDSITPGNTLAAPPVEWLPAATYLGDAICAAGNRSNPIGWHGTYLAVAGSFLHLGAAPEAVEALVAYVADRDPVWCGMRTKWCENARSTVTRWCAGDTVMGLGKLSKALGSTVASRFRSLAPLTTDDPAPVSEAPHTWTALDYFSFNDPVRALAVMDALRKGAEEYKTLMVARQAEADKVDGTSLHYGCQRAGREAAVWASKFRKIQDDLNLTRWNCTDADMAPVSARAVHDTKTRHALSAPNHCRKTHCTHCGQSVLASHFCGLLLGPVRDSNGEWDLTPMADRTLFVYRVMAGDIRKFQRRFAEEVRGLNLPTSSSDSKQIKAVNLSRGWVGFDREDGSPITILSDLDITGPRRRGSFAPATVGVLVGRATVLAAAHKLAVATFSRVALPLTRAEAEAEKALLLTSLDLDLVAPAAVAPVRYGVGGALRSSDSLISDPQTIVKQAQAHSWTRAADSTSMEKMAEAAYKLGIPVTVQTDDPDTLTPTKVVVNLSACTEREVMVYNLEIEECHHAIQRKQAALDTHDAVAAVVPTQVDFAASEAILDALLAV